MGVDLSEYHFTFNFFDFIMTYKVKVLCEFPGEHDGTAMVFTGGETKFQLQHDSAFFRRFTDSLSRLYWYA
jgi:hypothetical protein